jgi:phosphoglycerol transferase MdoB-like AlkP superfamily enzyme
MILSFSKRQHRFNAILLLTLLIVSISMITRLLLLIKSGSAVDYTFLNLLGIFFIGLFFDLVNASYAILPLVLYVWLMPSKVYNKRWHRFVLYGIFFFFTFLLLFNAVSEWLFWDEFNTRFNFIAVDYLVYTTEVIGNIQQSYPITWIVVGILVLAAIIIYLIRSAINSGTEHAIPFKRRTVWAVGLIVLPMLLFFAVSIKFHHFSSNAYVNELSGNGLYELFAAYRNNELNYDQFYKRIETDVALKNIRSLIATKESTFINNDPQSITREIKNGGPEKRLNVVMISVESFSADFMKMFGNTKNITPFLDSLAQHSMVFTNLYATGTRTVRGLEALSICVPPTPGQSIVRRPENENLFSLGEVFNQKGYESKYIYGGYGYFDNMSYFFGNNGYKVVDRDALSAKEIDYENIWGVADENLFTLAIREIETTLATNKPIFAQVMTTSNHRPFTYPDGRIDIPSHTGRDGAVKYTDYAIGRFIKECSKKPWFNNTVFVIVADHCASSAGKTELPINKYHIPLIVYSPANVQPTSVDRLMSQIDLGPTLLGMLNFSYTSKFYGYDIFKLEPGRERVFISTYQTLGFMKNDSLVVLSPQKKLETFKVLEDHESLQKTGERKLLEEEAISWYQASSYAFKNGLMKK